MKFILRIPNNLEVRKESCPHSRERAHGARQAEAGVGCRGGGNKNSPTFRCWLSPHQLPLARAGLLQGTKSNFIRMMVRSPSKSF